MSDIEPFVDLEDIQLVVKDRKRSKEHSPLLDGNRKERSSHRHFKYKGKTRPIDFVLAAKNETDEVIDKKRKVYFRGLKRKRLKISSPVLSQVSYFSVPF